MLLLLLLHAPLFAAPKVVSVATLDDYPPLIFSLEKQHIHCLLKPGEDSPVLYGYSWDVFRESFSIMGYTIELNVKPWARSLKEFNSGEHDLLFPSGKNSERLKIFNYSQQRVNDVRFVIYLNADNPQQWKELNALKGKNIGVVQGFNYGDEWPNAKDINRVALRHILSGFEMLQRGRLDGFLGYERIWDYHIVEQGWTSKFRKELVLGYENEYVAALKSNPRGQKLLDDFDLGKQRLINSGRLQQLRQKWSLPTPAAPSTEK